MRARGRRTDGDGLCFCGGLCWLRRSRKETGNASNARLRPSRGGDRDRRVDVGGAIGGVVVGGKAIGNEVAAMMGGFFGPLAGASGVLIGLILIAILH